MADVEIGAARVHLVVDAADYDNTIARALNSAKGFGSAAEAAFDQSSKGARRASTSLLDYVANLGRTSTEQQRFMSLLQKASRQGTDPTILKAGLDAWNKYAAGIELAATKAKELATAQTEAGRMNAEFDRQRGAEFDEAVRIDQARTALDRYVASLGKVAEVAPEVQRAMDLGVDSEHVQKASAAVEAYTQKVRELAAAQDEASRMNAEFDRQRQQSAQDAINAQVAPGLAQKDAGYLAQQRAAVQRLEAEYQKLAVAETAAHAHNDAADRQIDQLKNLQLTAGKTWYELQKLRNAQLGISKVADPLVDAIQKQNSTMRSGTLTAKQYEFAMRGLPAQITDIGVSLAMGQRPLMVFLAQGGQLKDMFGGVKPAVKALGTALLNFINPVTVTAAALGALVFAAYQAEQRIQSFGITAARSGDYAGTTQSLLKMADALHEVDGVSRSVADEAVTKLASSGLLAGKNLALAAEASARWASATGDAVDTVSQKFEQIARDPLAALTKLNQAEHFLTEAQYDRIRALEEQGDTQGAVTEATKLYYDVVSRRTTEAQSQISNMTQAWRDTKSAISGAAEAVGRYAEFLASAGKAQRDMPAWQKLGPIGGIRAAIQGMYNAKPAGYDEAFAKATAPTPLIKANQAGVALTDAQVKANEALQKAWESSGTDADKLAVKVRELNKELQKATPAALAEKNIQKGANGTFSGAGYQRLVDALKPKAGATSSPALDSGRDATQAIKDQMKAELAALQTQTQQVQAQYQLRDISAAEYYDKLRGYAEQERDTTVRGNQQQIAALAGTKNAEREISSLRAENAEANERYTQRTIALDTQETQATRQRQLALQEYVRTLQASNDGVQRQMDAMVARVSLSDREYEQLQARNQILQQQTDKLAEIQKLVDEYPNSADVAADADARRQAVMVATAEALQKVTDGYTELQRVQSDWNVGAAKAWDDWLDKIRDNASAAKEATTSFLDGFVTATADSLRGVKGAYGKLLDDLYQKALEFAIKQAALKLFGGGGSEGSIFDLFSSGGGKWGQYAQGGVPGGPGLSAYRNQIVSTPTFFPFARGGVPNIGLMGEKPGRSEGILPLAKMSNGDLGVQVKDSANKEPSRIVNLTQQFIVQGVPNRMTRDQMARSNARETSYALNK